jgi:hypothetical protein
MSNFAEKGSPAVSKDQPDVDPAVTRPLPTVLSYRDGSNEAAVVVQWSSSDPEVSSPNPHRVSPAASPELVTRTKTSHSRRCRVHYHPRGDECYLDSFIEPCWLALLRSLAGIVYAWIDDTHDCYRRNPTRTSSVERTLRTQRHLSDIVGLVSAQTVRPLMTGCWCCLSPRRRRKVSPGTLSRGGLWVFPLCPRTF